MRTSLLLGLPRPQYVSVPEAFITALAARAHRVDYRYLPTDTAPAVVYEANSLGRQRASLPHQTRPAGPALGRFADQLEAAGLYSYDGQDEVASAVARGIAGVRTRAWRGRSAIPVSVGLALAQNLRGLVGAKNPPDLALILERFYAMGAPAGSDGRAGAAQTWSCAAERRMTIDPLVGTVDSALSKLIFESGYTARTDRLCAAHGGAKGSRQSTAVATDDDLRSCLRIHNSTDDFQGTPFSWFYRTWSKLCDDVWVDALPARVWVDWANTVLRLAFGMGYLWEVVWYESIAQSVIQNDGRGPDELARGMGALLPWRDAAASVSVRDIAASTRRRVMRSNGVRSHLQAWAEANRQETRTAAQQLRQMSRDSDLRTVLGQAMSDSGNTNANLWEAINYSLLTRVGSGQDTDHYGLLRKHGPRYTVPDPGVEWLAAIASLSCPGPSESTNVAIFMSDLKSLGLRPERGDLVRRLEGAGVARGSADADQAVEIRAAF